MKKLILMITILIIVLGCEAQNRVMRGSLEITNDLTVGDQDTAQIIISEGKLESRVTGAIDLTVDPVWEQNSKNVIITPHQSSLESSLYRTNDTVNVEYGPRLISLDSKNFVLNTVDSLNAIVIPFLESTWINSYNSRKRITGFESDVLLWPGAYDTIIVPTIYGFFSQIQTYTPEATSRVAIDLMTVNVIYAAVDEKVSVDTIIGLKFIIKNSGVDPDSVGIVYIIKNEDYEARGVNNTYFLYSEYGDNYLSDSLFLPDLQELQQAKTLFYNPTTGGVSYGDTVTGGGGGAMVYPTGSGVPVVASGTSWGTTLVVETTLTNDDTHTPTSGAVYGAISGGGGMVYPGAGIALSTGSAWGTSITNNSANWNTAYGWDDHSTEGYLTAATALFTKTGTDLSPTTAGDDILLPLNSILSFGDGDTYFSESSDDHLWLYAGGNAVMNFNTGEAASVLNLNPNTSKNIDLGQSSVWWDNAYVDRLYVDAVGTYLDVSGTDMTFTSATSGTVTLASLVAGPTSLWKDNGTSLSPTTAGDDILLASSTERIMFGDGDSYIYESADDLLAVEIGGSWAWSWGATNIVAGRNLVQSGTKSYNLGSSSNWWNNLYIDDIFIDNANTTIGVSGTDMTLTSADAGTVALADILTKDAKGTMYIIRDSTVASNTSPNTVMTLPAGAVIWDIQMDITELFDGSGTNYLEIGRTGDADYFVNDYDLTSGTGFQTMSLLHIPYRSTASIDITFEFTDENSDAFDGKAYFYIKYSLH